MDTSVWDNDDPMVRIKWAKILMYMAKIDQDLKMEELNAIFMKYFVSALIFFPYIPSFFDNLSPYL